MAKISMMDLPNEMLVEIFKYLDIPNRLKFRVNKRLDRLELSTPNYIKCIELKILTPEIIEEFSLVDHSLQLTIIRSEEQGRYSLLHRLRNGLPCYVVWLSTRPLKMFIFSQSYAKEISLCIDLLFAFSSERLKIFSRDRLDTVTLPRLLTLAQNAEDVSIYPLCSALTMQDLCSLREEMLHRDCKLKNIGVRVCRNVAKLYLEDRFGLSIDGIASPLTPTYRCKDQSVALYSQQPRLGFTHFQDNIKTTFDWTHGVPLISFEKSYDVPDESQRIMMNHVYTSLSN